MSRNVTVSGSDDGTEDLVGILKLNERYAGWLKWTGRDGKERRIVIVPSHGRLLRSMHDVWERDAGEDPADRGFRNDERWASLYKAMGGDASPETIAHHRSCLNGLVRDEYDNPEDAPALFEWRRFFGSRLRIRIQLEGQAGDQKAA